MDAPSQEQPAAESQSELPCKTLEALSLVRDYLPDWEVSQLRTWATTVGEGSESGHRSGEEGDSGEDVDSDSSSQLNESDLDENSKRKARKWLVKRLNNYSMNRAEVRRSEGSVNVEHFNAVMAHTLAYLRNGDTSFGKTGLSWIIWTNAELNKLLRSSDDLLAIEMLQPVCVCVHKMVEHAMTNEIIGLLNTMVAILQKLHQRNYSDAGAASSPPDIEPIGNSAAGKGMISLAASILEDSDPNAEIFLLNSASLLAHDSPREAECLMLRATSLVDESLQRSGDELAALTAERNDVRGKLESADATPLDHLPAQGTVFLVRVAPGGGPAAMMESVIPALEAEADKIEQRIHMCLKSRAPMLLRGMACCRKLGSLYLRGAVGEEHSRKASRCAARLKELSMEAQHIPLKDRVANTSFLTDHGLLKASRESNYRRRHDAIAQCQAEVAEVIDAVEERFGSAHVYTRAAEAYEKAALTGMLSKAPPDRVLKWAETAVTLHRCLEADDSLFMARALGILSEAHSFAGELDQAIEMAEQSGSMATALLGSKHPMAKIMGRLALYHRALYMKCSNAGFSVLAMRASCGKMMLGRVDTPEWIRSWVTR